MANTLSARVDVAFQVREVNSGLTEVERNELYARINRVVALVNEYNQPKRTL